MRPARCVFPPTMTLAEIGRDAILQTLERTGGNIKKTARILNVHRPTIYRKLRKIRDEGDDPAALIRRGEASSS